MKRPTSLLLCLLLSWHHVVFARVTKKHVAASSALVALTVAAVSGVSWGRQAHKQKKYKQVLESLSPRHRALVRAVTMPVSTTVASRTCITSSAVALLVSVLWLLFDHTQYKEPSGDKKKDKKPVSSPVQHISTQPQSFHTTAPKSPVVAVGKGSGGSSPAVISKTGVGVPQTPPPVPVSTPGAPKKKPFKPNKLLAKEPKGATKKESSAAVATPAATTATPEVSSTKVEPPTSTEKPAPAVKKLVHDTENKPKEVDAVPTTDQLVEQKSSSSESASDASDSSNSDGEDLDSLYSFDGKASVKNEQGQACEWTQDPDESVVPEEGKKCPGCKQFYYLKPMIGLPGDVLPLSDLVLNCCCLDDVNPELFGGGYPSSSAQLSPVHGMQPHYSNLSHVPVPPLPHSASGVSSIHESVSSDVASFVYHAQPLAGRLRKPKLKLPSKKISSWSTIKQLIKKGLLSEKNYIQIYNGKEYIVTSQLCGFFYTKKHRTDINSAPTNHDISCADFRDYLESRKSGNVAFEKDCQSSRYEVSGFGLRYKRRDSKGDWPLSENDVGQWKIRIVNEPLPSRPRVRPRWGSPSDGSDMYVKPGSPLARRLGRHGKASPRRTASSSKKGKKKLE